MKLEFLSINEQIFECDEPMTVMTFNKNHQGSFSHVIYLTINSVILETRKVAV